MDPQANATTAFGIELKPQDKSIYDVIINNSNIKNCVKQTEINFLDILPSCSKLAGAEIELVSMFTRESILKESLKTNDWPSLEINNTIMLNLCYKYLGKKFDTQEIYKLLNNYITIFIRFYLGFIIVNNTVSI